MDEFFYGTLPQDTQDFSQVLRGVRRSIGDIGRGVSYYPYDLVGAPVDLINMALTPVGLGSERPVLGSDYLRNIAQSLGLAQPSTGSGAETAGRFGAAFVNPAAGARAVGQASQAVTRGANLSADKLVQMITGNPQATAPRVLEETSMPFMQAMAPKTPTVPGLMEPAKSDIGFYSQLEAATIPLQNKGTGDQYLAQIQKSAGVKPEEIQWTGLDEFLKGKKSVTKQEIQDYLNANRVDVQEVRLGSESNPYPYRDSMQWQRAISAAERQGNWDEVDRLQQAWEASEGYGPAGMTKFSKYTLPGGENYREILLTLPEKLVSKEDISQRMFGKPYTQLTDQERFQVTPEFQKTMRQDFRSTHFDQPNILAHMRVNDRVVDGKKTLFIEEIQSDWHQAGRKRGYVDPNKKTYEVRLSINGSRVNADGETVFETREEAQALVDRAAASPSLTAEIVETRPTGIPDAPFKTSWHELTLKRAIQEASEKGYDQIAFTTGKTQAERYDLSKQIDEINVVGRTNAVTGEKSKSVALDTVDGQSIRLGVAPDGTVDNVNDQNMNSLIGKSLDEVVGKELAKKIMEGGSQTISGEGLKVGGEGMEGFYDNILPKSLEKLGKKFDAKVGKTEMDGVEVWQMDITPKMRESVTTKGQPLFAVPAVGAGLLGAGMYQDEQMF